MNEGAGERRLTSESRDTDEIEDGEEHSVAADRMHEYESQPLFASVDSAGFHERWLEIQAAFVDEPRRAVNEADTLVAEVIQRLTRTFADELSSLESQWDRDGDVSTEDLRLALQRYRSLLDRLLSA